jgi:T-complex protein 1 subunit theta
MCSHEPRLTTRARTLTQALAIKLASHAANTVLGVDQIIMAKQAGGPRAKENPDWDDER